MKISFFFPFPFVFFSFLLSLSLSSFFSDSRFTLIRHVTEFHWVSKCLLWDRTMGKCSKQSKHHSCSIAQQQFSLRKWTVWAMPVGSDWAWSLGLQRLPLSVLSPCFPDPQHLPLSSLMHSHQSQRLLGLSDSAEAFEDGAGTQLFEPQPLTSYFLRRVRALLHLPAWKARADGQGCYVHNADRWLCTLQGAPLRREMKRVTDGV